MTKQNINHSVVILLVWLAFPVSSFSQEKLPVQKEIPDTPARTQIFLQKYSQDKTSLIRQTDINQDRPVFQQHFLGGETQLQVIPDSPVLKTVPRPDDTKNNSTPLKPGMLPFNDLSGIASQMAEETSVVACDEYPIGTDDYFLTSADRTLTVDAPGFLINDIDLQGEAITATAILDSPDHGILSAFPDGHFTYEPDPDFVGTDQFVYRMRDASLNYSEPVTVVIEITGKTDRIPIGTNDHFTAVTGTSLSVAAPGFLANDIDPDGEALIATAILSVPENGGLTAFPDGSFTYTPDVDFTGADQFQYRMRDESLNYSEPVTVFIDVVEGNRPPVGNNDLFGVVENTTLAVAASGFLANDFDPDGDVITATAILSVPEHGTLTAFPDGHFTYTPNSGYTGMDMFTYRMRDDALNYSEPVTVTLEVIPGGVLPVGFEDNYYTSSDRPLEVDAPGFLANDVDLNGEALTATAILETPSHGTLTAFPDGHFSYTPDSEFAGTDQFQYRMRDASLNYSDPVIVTIEVTGPANRPPVGNDDEFAMTANTILEIQAPGFLANDIDPDGEVITATAILDVPDNGLLTAFPDGAFTYTPNEDFTGTDQFQYRMRDASLNYSDPVTVTIQVYPGNRNPVGVSDTFAVVINTPLTIDPKGFLINDFDPDGDEITATAILEVPSHGSLTAFPTGQFTYTPDADYTGIDQFQYRMRDALLNYSEPVTVTLFVAGPNAAPIAVAADMSVECEGPAGTTVLLDGSGSSDPEEGILTYSWYENGTLIAGPSNSPTAEILFATGSYQVTLTVEDDCGKTDSDIATIAVVDTTQPTVTAAFEPTMNSNEYMIACSAEDVCSENITTASLIVLPEVSNPQLKLKNDGKYEVEIDAGKNQVSVKAPNAQAFWNFLIANGGIPVDDGQIITAKYDKNKYKFEFDNSGNLEKVSGDVITLLCTATDGNSNIGSAEATLPMNMMTSLGGQANITSGFEADGHSSYPNPFAQVTTIRYRLEQDGPVRVAVYDQSGREITVLFDGPQPAGAHEIRWNGANNKQGVYFYQISQENSLYRGKMMLLRDY